MQINTKKSAFSKRLKAMVEYHLKKFWGMHDSEYLKDYVARVSPDVFHFLLTFFIQGLFVWIVFLKFTPWFHRVDYILWCAIGMQIIEGLIKLIFHRKEG